MLPRCFAMDDDPDPEKRTQWICVDSPKAAPPQPMDITAAELVAEGPKTPEEEKIAKQALQVIMTHRGDVLAKLAADAPNTLQEKQAGEQALKHIIENGFQLQTFVDSQPDVSSDQVMLRILQWAKENPAPDLGKKSQKSDRALARVSRIVDRDRMERELEGSRQAALQVARIAWQHYCDNAKKTPEAQPQDNNVSRCRNNNR